MTLLEIAQIYTDMVLLDDHIPENEHTAKEEVGILRSKYHQLFMDKLNEEGIDYYDRLDAMNKAFDIIRSPNNSFKPTRPQAGCAA